MLEVTYWCVGGDHSDLIYSSTFYISLLYDRPPGLQVHRCHGVDILLKTHFIPSEMKKHLYHFKQFKVKNCEVFYVINLYRFSKIFQVVVKTVQYMLILPLSDLQSFDWLTQSHMQINNVLLQFEGGGGGSSTK